MKIQRKLHEVITLEEFEKILKHSKKPEHKLAFKLGFLCCLRISEILKLQKKDIDKNRGYLFIRQAKGNKDRYVPIAKPLSNDLKNIPIKIKRRAIQHTISKISQEAINKRIHLHTLRHSGATFYLNKGMNLREIHKLMPFGQLR